MLGIFLFLGIVALVLRRSFSPPRALLSLIDVLAYAGVLYIGFRQTHRPFRRIFSFAPVPPVLVGPLIPLVIGAGVIVSEVDNLTRWLVPVPRFISDVFGDLLGSDALSLVSLTVLAPVNEELLFRGLILAGFTGRYPAVPAVVASAGIFALFHLNPYQYFAALLMGIILAWLFLRTRSLGACMLAHALYNGQLWLVANVVDLGIPGYDALPAAVVQFQPLWFDLLGAALLLGGVLGVRRLLRGRDAAGFTPR